MKKVLTILCAMSLMISLSAQSEKKIVILHTNDLHSRLTGYAPESAYTPLTINDDNTSGGFARIAAIIKNEKNTNSGVTLVVDAGDFLMGTFFQGLETKTGFQLSLMKKMGYDVVCIGNHEFDYGPEKLADIINSAIRNGETPTLLLSNAEFDSQDSNDDSLEKLFINNDVGKKLVLTRDGQRIGFFSLMGIEADDNAAYAPPVTFSKQIPMARKMVKELQQENCDIIICLSHSGVTLDKNGEWGGEDVELAEKVKGIDIIISGHSHSRLEKPVIINGIPVIQTGEYGRSVGRLSLTSNNGKVSIDDYSLIAVDDRVAGDTYISGLIEDQKNKINALILNPLGMNYKKVIAESDFLLECNEQGDIEGSNLGPLVADAINSYVNRNVETGVDMSMVAVGIIRDKIVPVFQSAPDIFRIMSMGMGKDEVPGYPLSRIYVTGKELKSILEILQIAYKTTPGNYCYYSGVRIEYNPEKGMLRKIKKIDIIHSDGNSVNVDFSKKNKTLYSLAANSYMLEFIGIIKKMSFGLINVVPKDASGGKITYMKDAIIDMDEKRDGVQEGKEWLALMEFLGSMKDTNGNGIPDIDKKYAVPVKSFFLVDDK